MPETRPIGPSPQRAATPAGPEPAERAARHPEFDALRATALLLVVTLHAGLAYTRFDIPRLLWGVRDPSAHVGFDVFSWWAMGVSVPLFFTMSGFFSARICDSRGLRGFVANRLRRIVLPFFVGSAIILPLCFLAWSYGWYTSGRCTYREICRMVFLDPEIKSDQYGPAHLWFLEYLILMLVGFVALRAARGGSTRPASGGAGRWLLAPWAPLALAIPTILIFKLSREAHGVDISLDRHNSFIPEGVRLVHYSIFFAFGTGLHRAAPRLGALAGRGGWYLVAALPLFAARAWLFPSDWSAPLAGAESWAMAAMGGLLAWLNVFGLIGVYRRFFARPSAVVRYLAASSYWVYLIHFPLVGLIQADLFSLPIPTVAKFAVTWALTMGVGLGSYQVLYRRPAKARDAAPPALLRGPHGARSAAGVEQVA